MATQKVRPEPGFVDRQHKNQRRRSRNRRTGAYVLVAALGLVAAVIVIRAADDGGGTRPAVQPTPTAVVIVPEVDYLFDLDTGAMTPLPAAIVGDTDVTEYPAVSPDGSMLAYVAPGDDGNLQIFVANLDGTDVRQLTHDRAAYAPAWSPDGAKIAYEGYGGGDVHNIFVVDLATGDTTQVTFETEQVFGTQFSPDGSAIVYAGGTPGLGVRLAPIAGGKHTLLVGGGGNRGDAGNGSLSPDGSLLTYALSGSGADRSPDRWVANADGSDPRPLVEGGPFLECSAAGTWSPDGSRIACSDGLDVVVVDVATGETTTVAEGDVAIWLDDHTLLVDI